jgi:hypothetical protein
MNRTTAVHLTDVHDYAFPQSFGTGHHESMRGRAQTRADCSGPLGFAIPGVKPRYRVAARAVESDPQ